MNDGIKTNFNEGKILTSQCGPNGIIICVTEESSQLGLIRVLLKDASKGLADIMNNMVTAEQDSVVRREESQSILDALKELESF